MTPIDHLMKAIYLSDRKAIAELAHANVVDLNALTDDGYTPLYEAVLRGRYISAITLIMCGANKNALNKGNVTALLLAVRLTDDVNRDDIVGALLRSGARDDIADRSGETAADVLRERGHAIYRERMAA